ncbi:ABC transporter permease [Georgenia yuyongxinii]|uniref:ABC transporter permease n=1 Tax=Georgenia yuyongxinii TaxID=2589797 RepID=A0A552WT01_9MICO|nr:ABC transporter permease [Georgenia yuyongxinii]TRW45874.1 ABC transporter permease [Georgenia yuyongxinii]
MSADKPSRTAVLRRLRGRNNEGVLALILILLVVGMSIANPVFFTVPTAFSILRSAIVPMIFALGVLLVIISGGIDMSFAAIAVFAAYTTIKVQLAGGFDVGLLGAFAMALVIGAGLGAINGFIIAKFRLPTMIVTLGTRGIFSGVLLAYVGSRYIADLPTGMASVSTTNLVGVETSTGNAYLHVMVIPAIVLVVLMAWVLRRTMFGRSIYAIGGDAEAARRAGIRVVRTQVLMYVLVGMMAAVAGMIYMIMGRSGTPQEMVGDELDIIAAVVLGGASIFGGRGSVSGTVLGVLLIQVINNSMILAGVPSAWQRTAVGLLLVVGIGIQAVAARRAARRVRTVDESDDDAPALTHVEHEKVTA